MPVPDFQTLMLPALRLASKSDIRARDAVDRLANEFALTNEERNEKLPSGRQTTLVNRVSWALIYLAKAGLLDRPERGIYRISPRGRTVLEAPPEKIDIRYLSRFEGFEDFRAGSASPTSAPADPSQQLAVQTPDERIETAIVEMKEALGAELIDRVRLMDPTHFEKLIVDLLLAMGYGTAGAGQHLGRSHDGGVDGVIHQDALRLDAIYLQAKRYAEGSAISVGQVREFVGALDEFGASKGVLVTTSHFARPALDYANKSSKRLVLIDGVELTRLLIQHGVGVRAYKQFQLQKLDSDYFDDFGN